MTRSTWILSALAIMLFAQSVLSGISIGQTNPIKHIIVLMQENRTFDHYFGTYPRVNGISPGTCIKYDPSSNSSTCVSPYHLSTHRTPDPPHDNRTARRTYDGGKMDGLLYAQSLKGFTPTDINGAPIVMGYYDYNDIPYYWNLANSYALADDFFSSVMGGSFENHLFLYAGTTQNSTGFSYKQPIPASGMNLTTIFDELQTRGISWKNYVQNYTSSVNYTSELDRLGLGPKSAQLVWAPLLGITRYVKDSSLNSKIVELSQFFLDLRANNLPSVAYISPSGESEHAPGDITRGQLFAVSLIDALMTSNSWWNTIFILTYDDWGGWYDHVPPRQVDQQGYGFRVPALIISPYAKVGLIDHTEYDFTSILATIEDLFSLPRLAGRDEIAHNMLNAFDMQSPPHPPIIPQGIYTGGAANPLRSAFPIWLSYAAMIAAVIAVPAILRHRRKGPEHESRHKT